MVFILLVICIFDKGLPKSFGITILVVCTFHTRHTHTYSNTCIAYLFCIITNILQINQKQVRKKLGKYSYLTSTINTHSSQCGILLSDFYFILYFRFSHCFFFGNHWTSEGIIAHLPCIIYIPHFVVCISWKLPIDHPVIWPKQKRALQRRL